MISPWQTLQWVKPIQETLFKIPIAMRSPSANVTVEMIERFIFFFGLKVTVANHGMWAKLGLSSCSKQLILELLHDNFIFVQSFN